MSNRTGIDDVPVGAGIGEGVLGMSCCEEPLPEELAFILVYLASQGRDGELHNAGGILCTPVGVNPKDS